MTVYIKHLAHNLAHETLNKFKQLIIIDDTVGGPCHSRIKRGPVPNTVKPQLEK